MCIAKIARKPICFTSHPVLNRNISSPWLEEDQSFLVSYSTVFVVEEREDHPNGTGESSIQFIQGSFLLTVLVVSPSIPNPQTFIGARIVQRQEDGSERRGLVLSLINMEGINSLFLGSSSLTLHKHQGFIGLELGDINFI